MTNNIENPWPITSDDPSVLAEFAALIGIDPAIEWQMETSEQLALCAMVLGLQPECVIEVGTRFGGSMQLFSRHSRRVISCDIDPTCQERLGARFTNAEFVVGPSQQMLPEQLARLQSESARVSLILIDGDHSTEGVREDIHALRHYRPQCTLYVVMHDSFNPRVRRGIRTARWAEHPYVHSVELDFIPGVLHSGGPYHREMWGGFALAVMRPEPRKGPLTISARKDLLYRSVFRRSAHSPTDLVAFTKRVGRKISRSLGLRR